MTRLFGTDGMRGEAGIFPLNASTIRATGRSLGVHLATRDDKSGTIQPPLILTGRDTRESGEWIERELIAGARETGARFLSAGVITTPGVAFLTRTMHADAGVVISASHNPYQDNGVKIFAPSGRKLDDETEQLIERDIMGNRHGDAQEESRPVVEADSQMARDLSSRYLQHLYEDVGAHLSIKGFRMVIDCANGAASEFAPALFERFGGSVLAINNCPNGRNINQDCGSLHMETLTSMVIRERADIGVAFDGDADRALFVDGRGQLVDGDATLWIMAQYLQKAGRLNGQVVATVMSNIGLEIALRSSGIQLLRTDVGDKYVLDEILRTGATLGGEQSGHIIFPDQSLAGDAMITTINMLGAMRESSLGLDALSRGFVRYPQVLLNVPVREKRPFAEVQEIAARAREVERKLGSTGRLLLRYSGTEALARVMIEGESQTQIEQLAESLALAIKKNLGWGLGC